MQIANRNFSQFSHNVETVVIFDLCSPHNENTTADSCIGQCAFKMIDEMSEQIGMNKVKPFLSQ